jgi:hypothetical protein
MRTSNPCLIAPNIEWMMNRKEIWRNLSILFQILFRYFAQGSEGKNVKKKNCLIQVSGNPTENKIAVFPSLQSGSYTKLTSSQNMKASLRRQKKLKFDLTSNGLPSILTLRRSSDVLSRRWRHEGILSGRNLGRTSSYFSTTACNCGLDKSCLMLQFREFDELNFTLWRCAFDNPVFNMLWP